ncbi:MAG TPA: BON domain-containing protein [Dongiaceae bacterium]
MIRSPAIRSVVWLMLAAGFSGCSPIGMAVGAGATVTNMAMEERGFKNAVTDNVIWLDINGRLLNKNAVLFKNVSLQVHEGRVLLTGFVLKPEDRIEATRLAWEAEGVREVVNETKVGRSLDFGDYTEDAFLIQEVKVKLFLDRDIRAINFSVDCIRSTIYLMGVARSPAELHRVIDHARDVPYVRAVVSHVRIKGDSLPPIPQNPPVIPEPPVYSTRMAATPPRPYPGQYSPWNAADHATAVRASRHD